MGIATYQSKLGQTAKQPSACQAQSARASVLQQYSSVLRNALPVELKAHGADLPMAEIDAMADALARQIAKLVDTSPVSKSRKATGIGPGGVDYHPGGRQSQRFFAALCGRPARFWGVQGP